MAVSATVAPLCEASLRTAWPVGSPRAAAEVFCSLPTPYQIVVAPQAIARRTDTATGDARDPILLNRNAHSTVRFSLSPSPYSVHDDLFALPPAVFVCSSPIVPVPPVTIIVVY